MRLRAGAATPDEDAAVLSGDVLVPGATIAMNRAATFPVPPDALWPWLVQLGKGRGGWYFPRWLDRLTPPGRRGLRHLDPSLQQVKVGDEHPDWGPGEPTLRVVEFDPARTLVYHSVRGDFEMSWQLVLTPAGAGTRLHHRVRARTKTRVFAELGDLFDGITVVLLFRGLRERIGP